MPPRASLTSSFSVTDTTNEVVCPLRNHDGSSCRKRCLGEKRYRSMQEHIRRAHPEHYISKLPATEESFALMINTQPSDLPKPPSQPQSGVPRSFGHERHSFYDNRSSSPATPRTSDEYHSHSLLPAASAAAALAQLHSHRPESDWESEPVSGAAYTNANGQSKQLVQETSFSDNDFHRHRPRSSIELPPIQNHLQDHGYSSHPYDPTRPRQLLPSILSRSPPGRSSTLPPIQRPAKPNRPRKSSVTQNARKPRHEKKTSKEHIRRMSYDRKAFSAEPTSAALGKRWEDLIDAAASATEEPMTDEDRTPVPVSPPQHKSSHRASLPPFPFPSAPHGTSYQASPLQNALTPPSYTNPAEAFPTLDASSGSNFHMHRHGLESSSSPAPNPDVEIYCAACRRLSVLRESFACTECICGVCRDCLDALTAPASGFAGGGSGNAGPGGGGGTGAMVGTARPCPRCNTVGGRWRPFQLDLR